MLRNLIPFLCFIGFYATAQTDSVRNCQISWSELAPGLSYCETDAPKVSFIGDSKLTMVKINPKRVKVQLLSATEYANVTRSAAEWADTFGLNIVINAGMYDLRNGLTNKGFMKNYSHLNNPVLHPSYNCMMAFNPKDSTLNQFTIFDLQCTNWEKEQHRYHSFSQGMRMLDCEGNPLSWNKKKQACSMLVAATDSSGAIYFIFTRSPYTHNEMIEFMRLFPFRLTHAIYLEGGPETSLYITIGNTVIQKIGSYVSDTYTNDDNDHFWKLPNVIGITLK